MQNFEWVIIFVLVSYIVLLRARKPASPPKATMKTTKWDLLSQKYGKKTGVGTYCSKCEELRQGLNGDCRCTNYGFVGEALQKELSELEEHASI